MFTLIVGATLDTLFIVVIALLIGVVVGFPTAAILFLYKTVVRKPVIYHAIEICINFIRSLPYVILVIALIPITRVVVGSSIGTIAAAFPLGVAASALITRVVYEAFLSVPKDVIDLARSMRASNWQIIVNFIVPESIPSILGGMTIVAINLVCYSAMAGMVGGGGLGDLAIRYGYQRYDYIIMIYVMAVLVAMVQTIQFLGNFLVNKTKKG